VPRAQTRAASGCRLQRQEGKREAVIQRPHPAPRVTMMALDAVPPSAAAANDSGVAAPPHGLTLANGALDVAHDQAVLVPLVEELHADLGHLTTRASAANDLHDDGELGWLILRSEPNTTFA
jgi:hypothetical protein